MSEEPVGAEMAAHMRAALEGIVERPVGEDLAAAREVGDRLRRVIDRLTATSAPPAVLRDAARRLEEVEDLLRDFHRVRDYMGSSEASGLGRDLAFFDWSPLLGQANPLAPPIQVAVEGRSVVGSVRFGMAYEGPPGCVHGGFIAAVFDEILGLAQSLSGRVGMTGTLTVKYRKPTPLLQRLRLEAEVESVAGRKVIATGRMLAGDVLTAEATGLFVTIRPEDFQALTAQREGGAAG
jgi:acyl-coenzyme A thioesterase PaaI-like protein